MSAWSVKTRRAPSWHCRDARVYGHATTPIHEIEYISPIENTPPPINLCYISTLHRCTASCFPKNRMQASIAPGLLAAAKHLAGGTSFTSSASGKTDTALAVDGDNDDDDGGSEIARPLHVGFISQLFGEQVWGTTNKFHCVGKSERCRAARKVC